MSLENLEDYGKEYIDKILHVLLKDKLYLNTIYQAVNPEHYEVDTQKWIVQNILAYHRAYNTTAPKTYFSTELKKLAEQGTKEKDFAKRLHHNLDLCYKVSDDECKDVKDEYRYFCVDKALEQAILTSADLMKYKRYDDISRLISSAIKLSYEREIGHDYVKDVEERYRIDNKKIVPLPFQEWNDRTNGGLRAGDLMLLFAPQGVGKSWLSIIIAAHALKEGFNVLYYSLELDAEDVGKRFDAKFTNIPINDLDENRKEIEEVLDSLAGELRIFRIKGKKKKLSFIKSHVKNLMEVEGFKPDMIVIDYIDKMKPESSSRDKDTDSDDAIEELFDDVRDFGSDIDCPIVSPSQINRSGSKDKVIENDKISGSYKKGMIADISLSVSRTKEDKLLNRARIHCMKNRRGYDGWTDEVYFDTATGELRIEGEYIEESDKGTLSPTSMREAAKKALLNLNM